MRKIARYIYIAVAWLAIVSFLATIYLAGMAVFADRSYWDIHSEIGAAVFLIFPGLILLGLLSWIPRRLTAWLVAMVVFYVLHISLPSLQEDLPWISAFHPVSAVVLVWLGLRHARRAGELLLQRPAARAVPAPADSPSQA